MKNGLTIAVILLVALGLAAIGVALTFRWRTEVRRNLHLGQEETRRRQAQTIASQMLSALQESERKATRARGRSRSAAPRASVQNRTRRSSRRASPFREQIRKVQVARSTIGEVDNAARRQQEQHRLPSPLSAPIAVTPLAPLPSPRAQPTAPPPSPPRPSIPAAGVDLGEWERNDVQLQATTQGIAQGQAEDEWTRPQGGWTASDGMTQTQDIQEQTQSAHGQAQAGWTATDGMAQGQASDEWNTGGGTTSNNAPEKPSEGETVW